MKRQSNVTLIAGLLIAALGAAQAQTIPSLPLPAGPALPASPHGMGAGAIPDGAALPAGHPSMDLLKTAPGMDTAASTQPNTSGVLTVQVVAGTAGAKLAPDEPVTIELYHRGTSIKKIEAKLDASGKIMVSNIPVMPPVEAMVTINHAGLIQQIMSPELSPDEPISAIQMKVYEATEDQPAWSVAMQHMIVQWDKDSAHVTEMISVTSPADRAWLGAKAAGSEQRVTMTIPLSPGATDLEVGPGLDDATTKVVDGALVTGSAIFPGRSEYRISYTLPAKNGALSLGVTTPAEVGNLFVFLPADGAQVTATGLSGGDVVDMGPENKVRMYKADKLAAGKTVTLAISDIGKPLPEVVAAANGAMTPKNIALGGAFLLVLAGAGMMMIRKPQPKVKKA